MKRLLVLLVAAAPAGCAAERLTESQEYHVGRGVAAQAIARHPLCDDETLEQYVARVGYTLALESDRPETFKGYTFGVLENDDINAFAAPGGFVFVTTGALKFMENEDELAGVLAHEIAHVNLRHPEALANDKAAKAGILGILSTGTHLGRMGGAIAGGVLGVLGRQEESARVLQAAEAMDQVVGAFGDILGDFADVIILGYGRDAELESDAMAVDLLMRPGIRYDPRALRAFVARLPRGEKGRGGIWSSHPDLADRVVKLDGEMEKRDLAPGIDPARTERFRKITASLR